MIGIDIGGTFTDFVYVDDDGHIKVNKIYFIGTSFKFNGLNTVKPKHPVNDKLDEIWYIFLIYYL